MFITKYIYYISVCLHIVYSKNSLILLHASDVHKSSVEDPLIGVGYWEFLLGFLHYNNEGWRAVVFKASDN